MQKHEWNLWEEGFHWIYQGLNLPGMETMGSFWDWIECSYQDFHSTVRKHWSVFFYLTINIILLKIAFASFFFTTDCIWIPMHTLLSHMMLSNSWSWFWLWNFLPQFYFMVPFILPVLVTEKVPLYRSLQIYVEPDPIVLFRFSYYWSFRQETKVSHSFMHWFTLS